MRVCVYGLWHLGCVTAAGLAAAGHRVVGLDPDPAVVAGLADGRPPLFETGLAEAVRGGLSAGRLRFTTDARDALGDADFVWVAFDTPVDDDDGADVGFVRERVDAILPLLRPGARVLVSSQVPVGTTRAFEDEAARRRPSRDVTFAYVPENLRLGRALETFSRPDRVVVGVRSTTDRERIAALLKPITERIEWMSVESAEMTKHAINAFLATSVAFINEIAALCERVGADAKEVERGLRSESRIGPRAYLGPGAAFAGGTLARDLLFLSGLARRHGLPSRLIDGVRASNDRHREWPRRRLAEMLGPLRDRRIAVWGLTYKAGTSTLRRSDALGLCRWLVEQGARVAAHDPSLAARPDELPGGAEWAADPLAAAAGADAVVVATEWPAYRDIRPEDLLRVAPAALVLDANRFLEATLGTDARVTYLSVGKAAG